jgi:hypothetical protein
MIKTILVVFMELKKKIHIVKPQNIKKSQHFSKGFVIIHNHGG